MKIYDFRLQKKFNKPFILLFMAVDKIEQLKQEVVNAAQAIYAKGLVEDGEGNVSIRLDKNEILCTTTSPNYDRLNPEKRKYHDDRYDC